MATDQNHYAGLVHAHSTYSFDGHLSYPELKEFFLTKGLSFASMTEHIEYLDQGQIDGIIADCRKYSDKDFVFIPGIEMDCFFIYLLGVDSVTVDFTDNHSIFRSLHEKAKLCIFSHPIKAKYHYPPWLIDICDGVEVLNTKHDGQHYLRPQSERLYRKIKQARPDAIAVAGMDFHSKKNYSNVRIRLTEKGPLTEDFILRCLSNKHFTLVKNDTPFTDFSFIQRNAARARIYAMDFAHNVHKKMAESGVTVPKGLKKFMRQIMEGY